VASVDNNGRVTAHTAGSTTITALAEGKQGTLGITVLDGALMGPAGGTMTMDNGAVTLTVPAGAVPTGTPITLVSVNPSGTQPANVQLTGAVYRLGPPGLTFAQPATVTLKYNTANFPAWAMAGDLTLVRNTAGQWGSLSDIAVDVNAGTVSGKTTGIPAASQGRVAGDGVAGDDQDGGADHSVGALPPQVGLTPGAGSVNAQQRSVRFHAGLVPRGGGVSMPATAPANTPQWKFRWRTTGQNGVLGGGGTSTGWTTNPDQQYIATVPVLNDLSGQIDMVFVDVLLNPDAENNPAQQRIVTAQAAINADLQTTYEISPDDKTIGPSASANFQLVVRDRQGNVLQPLPGSEFTWQSTSNHGSLGPTTPTQAMATYNSAGTFNFPPPRVDEITATVEGVTTVVEREVVWDFSEFPPKMVVVHHNEELRELRGEAKAFVTVKVDYTVKLEPVSNNVSVGGNKQLQVVLDPPYNGPGLEYKYTNSAAHGDLNVANGVRTASKQVTYTAKQFSNGGTDQLEVEVVSVVAGVQLESLGKGNATVEVDPWRNGLIGPAQQTTDFGTWFTSAQIRVAKVAGATQYEVKAETPDGLYTKTFAGATSSNPFSVNEVLDGGTHWLINIEAGFNSIESAADARWNIYFNKYKDTVVRYKATQ
jgi:hypothetical protein